MKVTNKHSEGSPAHAGKPVSATANSGLEFTHKGRSYTLFTLKGQPNYYVRAQSKGTRRTKCTQSPIKSVAIRNAKVWLDAYLDADWAKVEELRLRSPYSTIGDILDTYEQQATAALKVKHPRMNAQALAQIVADAKGISRERARELRADVLTADLVRSYVRNSREAGLQDVSIDSRLTCARSVFSRASMDNVLRNLKLPDLSAFRSTDCALAGARDLGFKPFSASQIRDLEAMCARARTEEPGIYLAYIAMARFGMRNVEVWNARWDWFVERENGSIVLDVRCNDAFETKSGESRMIAVSPECWQDLQAVRGEGIYFLPGATKTERRNLVERRLNDLIRPILASYRKRAYELRRWAGSRVWTEQGPAAAKEFLGHASVTTTERYYSKFLGEARAVAAPVVIPFPKVA